MISVVIAHTALKLEGVINMLIFELRIFVFEVRYAIKIVKYYTFLHYGLYNWVMVYLFLFSDTLTASMV
jgi:hypothetical protein